MSATWRVLASLPFLLALAAAARGGSYGEEWVREVSRQAVTLQEDGRHDEAVAALSAGLARCGAAPAGRECRAVLHYTVGYVKEREFARAGKGELRRAAIAAYERVLADEPGHRPSIEALARLYASSEAGAKAIDLLSSASAARPADPAYAIQLGDAYLAARQPKQALAAYDRAGSVVPAAAAVHPKVVDAFALLPPSDQAELLARAQTWSAHDPSAARAAFEAVMARSAKDQPRLAEAALVEWVDQQGRMRALTDAAVAALPLDETLPAIRDLRQYLAQPWTAPPAGSWWLGSEERMEALARASLALGSEMLLREKPEDAERCWQTSARFFPWPSVAKVEVQSELAGLYARHPELDRSGEKADRLVQELFEGKGRAYRRGDLAAIQQYHTVLGVFLFERGVHGTAETPKSAIFQLEHALQMALRRESQGMPYQPLAGLRARLAESYEKAGRADLAAKAFAIAAQAFLDEDQMPQARAAMARVEALGGRVPKPLPPLVALREAVRSAPAAAETTALAENAFAAPWGPELTAAFRERQEFKVLADRAKATRSVALAARALARSREKPLVLVGAADYLRLEGVERLVADRFRIERSLVRYASPWKTDPGLRVYYAASTPDADLVWLPPDTLLAARVTEAAGTPPADASLRLEGATLVIEAGSQGIDHALQKFRTAAASVPGVRSVVVE